MGFGHRPIPVTSLSRVVVLTAKSDGQGPLNLEHRWIVYVEVALIMVDKKGLCTIGSSPSSSSNVCLLEGNIGGASRTRSANSVSGGTEDNFWCVSETRVAPNGSGRKGFGSTMSFVKFFRLPSSEGRKAQFIQGDV
jgi:hypothetical protein